MSRLNSGTSAVKAVDATVAENRQAPKQIIDRCRACMAIPDQREGMRHRQATRDQVACRNEGLPVYVDRRGISAIVSETGNERIQPRGRKLRHPRAGGKPVGTTRALLAINWVPACAGMTCRVSREQHRELTQAAAFIEKRFRSGTLR